MRIFWVSSRSQWTKVVRGLENKGHLVRTAPLNGEIPPTLEQLPFDLLVIDWDENPALSHNLVIQLQEGANDPREKLSLVAFGREPDNVAEKSLVDYWFATSDNGSRVQDQIDRLALNLEPAAINRSVLDTIYNGHDDVFNHVVGLFLEDAPHHMHDISQCLEETHLEGIQKATHALKGAATNLAAEGLAEAARHMEQGARKNDEDTVWRWHGHLYYEFERLKKHLETLRLKDSP